ncbi:MAG TPA: phage holin family protein [Chloroflexota bacterium]|nr:phage holin family protein [Chloroflexota bacterium]
MEPIPIQNVLIVFGVATIVNGLIIWTVSSLKLGLWVRGFLTALIAAIVIATIGTVVRFVLAAIGVPNLGGIPGFVERLIISVVVLMASDKLLPGLTVHGFKGAVIAALAIGVIMWVVELFLRAGGIETP